MTDRANALIVVLEKNIRTDDLDATLTAIKQIKGVADVNVNVATPGDYVAEQRAKRMVMDKLWKWIVEETER